MGCLDVSQWVFTALMRQIYLSRAAMTMGTEAWVPAWSMFMFTLTRLSFRGDVVFGHLSMSSSWKRRGRHCILFWFTFHKHPTFLELSLKFLLLCNSSCAVKHVECERCSSAEWRVVFGDKNKLNPLVTLGPVTFGPVACGPVTWYPHHNITAARLCEGACEHSGCQQTNTPNVVVTGSWLWF